MIVLKIRKIIVVFIVCLALFLINLFAVKSVIAHESLLDVEYDNCSPKKIDSDGISDGENETQYSLYNISENSNYHFYGHISENVTTIKYRFEEFAPNDSAYTRTSEPGISDEIAQEIKNSYINSMLKWNSVYYYSYDQNGNRISNKVINIEVATSEENSNLKIYPIKNGSFILLNGIIVLVDEDIDVFFKVTQYFIKRMKQP